MGLGAGANLWKAVKLAKNLVTSDLPTNLTLGGEPVAVCDVANSFVFCDLRIYCGLRNNTFKLLLIEHIIV